MNCRQVRETNGSHSAQVLQEWNMMSRNHTSLSTGGPSRKLGDLISLRTLEDICFMFLKNEHQVLHKVSLPNCSYLRYCAKGGMIKSRLTPHYKWLLVRPLSLLFCHLGFLSTILDGSLESVLLVCFPPSWLSLPHQSFPSLFFPSPYLNYSWQI